MQTTRWLVLVRLFPVLLLSASFTTTCGGGGEAPAATPAATVGAEGQDIEAIRDVFDAYIAAYHEPDEAARARVLDQVFADDGVEHDNLQISVGPGALSKFIRDLQQLYPGFRIEITSGLDVHHGWVRTTWDFLGADGSPIFKDNMAFTETRGDGRVHWDSVFGGPPPRRPGVVTPFTGEDAAAVRAVIEAYVAAWNEGDEAARRALLEKAWADNGSYLDPQSQVEGREALVTHISAFRQQSPGARLEVTSGIDVHHDELRFTWKIVGRDGSTLSEGVNLGSLGRDGRLARIVAFFGPPPPKS